MDGSREKKISNSWNSIKIPLTRGSGSRDIAAMQTLHTPQTEVYEILNFYFFFKMDDVETFRAQLEGFAETQNILGLAILAHEGLNGTFAAKNKESLLALEAFLKDTLSGASWHGKWSQSVKPPFSNFVVKLRPEIVTLGKPELFPDSAKTATHLSPEEWDKKLKSDRSQFHLVDTRNWYESEIGTFKGAIKPAIDQFTDFPTFLESQPSIKKEDEILIFCTGGIRCEKGILDLKKRGYSKVYQLEGGILNYLEKFPQSEFEGECFVFDDRVAVKQDLSPTETYSFCPHCGQPAATQIECSRCDTSKNICSRCLEIEILKETCSKNCAHHFRLNPRAKGRHQKREFELPRR